MKGLKRSRWCREVQRRKVRRTPASSGVLTFFPSECAANSGRGQTHVKIPVPGGNGGAHVGRNDDTAGHCVRGTHYGQVLEPWTGAILKDSDVGHILLSGGSRWGGRSVDAAWRCPRLGMLVPG